MRPTTFRKTLLAMAITATALPAYAAEIPIGDVTAVHDIAAPAADAATKLTGTITGDIENALTLELAAAEGELELATTVTLEGAAAKAGFLMGATADAGLKAHATEEAVKGNLTQSGSITVKNADAAALRLTKAAIEGNLSNTGTLLVEGAKAHAIDLTADTATIGGSLINAEGATITANGEDAKGISLIGAKIAKDLQNAGTLTAEGVKAIAIALGAKAEVTGNLLNNQTGTITVTGKDAIGISLNNANVLGELTNNGELAVDGENVKGIALVADSEIGKSLVNMADGKITVTGKDAIGISLNKAKVLDELKNSGELSVKGDNAKGIDLATSSEVGKSLTNMLDGTVTVTGENAMGISLAGSKISETLENVGKLNVDGDGAKAINVASNSTIGTHLLNSAFGEIIAKGKAAIGIVVADSIISGDLSNNGTLTADGEDAKAIELAEKAEITGNLFNGGKIIVTENTNATGISLLADSEITGALSNAGSIDAKGTAAKAIDLATNSKIKENLRNTENGKINVAGENATGISLAGEIEKSLINGGTLDVSGANAIAIKLAATGKIGEDLRNEKFGQIFATGESTTGILFDQANIAGKLVNQGSISVDGDNATAIKMSNGAAASDTSSTLASLENSGRLFAQGENSFGLNVDGAHFTRDGGDSAHILNSGEIKAQTGTAIRIGEFVSTLDNAALNISNSGTLIGGTAALDATAATHPVNLTLNNGSKVTGDLLGLTSLTVKGDTQFNGSTAITMATGGNIHVGTDADNAGHLSLEQAHSIFTGNLNVSEGSSLALNLGNDTNPEMAILNVTGDATFDDKSQIKVKVSRDDFKTEGRTYTLVTASGTLTANADIVDLNNSSPLLDIKNIVGAQSITTEVSVKDGAQIAAIVGEHGANANTQLALTNLAGDGVLAKMPAGDALFTAFANADAKQLAVLAKQLAPEVGGAAQAATGGQALVSNVTGGRTSAARGQSSGDTNLQTGIWAQTLNSDATQGMRDGIGGYNAKSRGMAFGADGKINDQVTLGAAYSHITTNVNSKNGNKTNVDGHAFTVYGGVEFGNAFIDGGLTYGLNDNHGKRTIAGTQAKADYNSDLLGLNLNAGYTYQITPQVLVEPRLAARYSQVNIDGYREAGSTASLSVEKQRHEALELGAGLRVASSFALGEGTLEPQVKLMGYHDFKADQTSTTSTFVLGSTPFVTSGPKAASNSYEAGVGADYKLGAVTLGLNYDYVGKSGFNADTVTAKLRYNF